MTAGITIDWMPYFPWVVVGLLGAVSLLVVGVAAWRRARGAGWRVLAVAALVLALANPTLVREERDALDDIVFVLADESASQRIGSRSEQTEGAVRHLLQSLDTLDRTEVRLLRAGDAPVGAQEDGTRLFTALREGLSKVSRQRVGGVVIVSDGQVHDAPETLESLGIDAPIHLLLTGGSGEADRRLVVKRAPSFGIVGRTLTMTLAVEDLGGDTRGGAPPALARVTVRRDGEEADAFDVPVGVEQEIDFTLDHRGPTVVEIEVAPGPNELTLANNRAAISVNGVRDRLRVLLVSGEPHAGERAWRNILKSDPSVDLVHFTILRPPEKQDGTPIRELSLIAFPTRELFEEKLDEFDLVIFDRYRRRGVLPSIYLENIAAYVEQGGALLEAVGPTFASPLSLYRTPLGRVLPGEPTGAIFERGYRPHVTDLGVRHPVTAELPHAGRAGEDAEWGRWFRQIDADAGAGSVVMSGVDERPLLILDRVGEGRVAQFLSDHMWLWSRGFEGGGPQAELLRRIAHWLMREPDLEEETLRASVNAGRVDVVRRSLETEHPDIEVIAPSGERQVLGLQETEPGRATVSFAAEETGLYRISDGEHTALAAIGPINPREFQEVRATADVLQPLVTQSGGTVVALADAALPSVRKVRPERERHGRDWIGLVGKDEHVVVGVDQAPLLPALALLLLVLGATLLAWHREGR